VVRLVSLHVAVRGAFGRSQLLGGVSVVALLHVGGGLDAVRHRVAVLDELRRVELGDRRSVANRENLRWWSFLLLL